ncbi:hypothetical protein PTSG_04488 [Salpingoeca rosetta]|uniref:MULE transposase domain-containing protein n=1 Tax=Salpingoeca rosetta (strain ATCC 50818 / BSB-021) TaxID=946362 RepID=F2U8Q0_SALR5|nr:uncharacterized protein PTSG_04488 [Salpingoeca rosetta]EGD72758.1 hypothetical protein PTSG_04488 [Salpingoeca rosetta]|eukprot:XP_004994581.1 hypothetical protein PTSG_04488 [Salpingoeca rosetta]
MIGNPAAQVQQVSARYGLTMSGSQMAEYAAQAQGRTHVKRQEEFDRLHSFVQWINANGHHAAHLMTKDGAFSELLFCLKLNGLSAKSPKVLFTDATHLSYNNMMLHLLCQLDADNKIFILGANITQQETKPAYAHLFQLCLSVMPPLWGEHTILSDLGTAVTSAINEIPMWHHGMCSVHMRRRLRHQQLFDAAMNATSVSDLEKALERYRTQAPKEAARVKNRICNLSPLLHPLGTYESHDPTRPRACIDTHVHSARTT